MGHCDDIREKTATAVNCRNHIIETGACVWGILYFMGIENEHVRERQEIREEGRMNDWWTLITRSTRRTCEIMRKHFADVFRTKRLREWPKPSVMTGADLSHGNLQAKYTV